MSGKEMILLAYLNARKKQPIGLIKSGLSPRQLCGVQNKKVLPLPVGLFL
ncbi:MAG: hypothetical protein ACO1OF_11190 [Adhaeribacter sp.]